MKSFFQQILFKISLGKWKKNESIEEYEKTKKRIQEEYGK